MQSKAAEPSLSVITVTYNAEDTLETCLHSVNTQMENNFLHIVIDGASADETTNILLKQDYKNLIDESKIGIVGKYYLSESDEGLYDAMNKALNLVRTSHVIFLNSDDYFFDSDVISRIKKNLRFGELQLHGICYKEQDRHRVFRPMNVLADDLVFDKSLRRAPHPCMVFPLTDLRYDLGYSLASDYQYVIQNLLRFGRPKLFNECSTVMVRSMNQLSVRHRDVMRRESRIIADKYYYHGRWGVRYRLLLWAIKNIAPILKKKVGSR